jgi:predicted 3-demethylubiquinone-9 3-methyltransferase (glyoxalase superfamily)
MPKRIVAPEGVVQVARSVWARQGFMPLGRCGFSRPCGWVNDRYGVSWQLNVA